MKYYQNVERPILPPVDLSIMQKTYDTLEQGHLKGVELASKLRSAIAQLPLNLMKVSKHIKTNLLLV